LCAREWHRDRIVVALNLGGGKFKLASAGIRGKVLVSTAGDRDCEPVEREFALHADEGLVIELDANSPGGAEFAIAPLD
jgi:hypothetical protein